jgi:hypothetical protein
MTYVIANSERVVIPANAGIQSSTTCVAHDNKKFRVLRTPYLNWIPAFAGMTAMKVHGTRLEH